MFDYRTYGLAPPTSRLPNPGFGPQTVAEVLDRAIVANPDAIALVGRTGRYTFAELDKTVNQACQALSKLNIQPVCNHSQFQNDDREH